jgi:putative toxin-antitoxin system antitoxin component (TIGR02293 family)
MESTAEFAAIRGIKVPPAVFSDHETFIETTRKGLSGKIVKQAVDALGHRDLFVRLLETTTGNLNRFYRRKTLNTYHSESILDTLRVFSKANSVFGDPDVAREWMDTAIPALGGQTPISLCDTFEGRNLVQAALRKIEYGEFV